MKNENTFENTECHEAEIVDSETPVIRSTLSPATKKSGDIFAERTELVNKHAGSLYDRIKGNGDDLNITFSVVIEEIIKETDNLLGNSLMFTQDGKLHDASTVSVKRSEILETLTRVLQRKKELFTNSSYVDYDSPVFNVFQMVCFERLTNVLDKLNMDVEQKQLVVTQWVDSMKDWQKDVKSRMDNVTNTK